MDKQNLMPQQAQPISRITNGQLPTELAELTEEVLGGSAGSSSVLPAWSGLCFWIYCSYGTTRSRLPFYPILVFASNLPFLPSRSLVCPDELLSDRPHLRGFGYLAPGRGMRDEETGGWGMGG